MFQFHILSGSKAGEVINCKETLVRVGRGSLVHVALPDPGVWDEHLEVRFEGVEIQAAVIGEALASHNGNPFQTTLLRNGDTLSAGAASFRVYLEPATQRSLRLREMLTWAAMAFLVLFQIFVIFLLTR